MAVYCIIDASGLVVNRVLLDDVKAWQAPKGCSIVAETDPLDIGGTYLNGVYTPPTPPPVRPVPPPAVLSQDLIAQFTVEDYAAIKDAIAQNDDFGLLWAALQTQKDPMPVANARFRKGWAALVQVLGQPRMDAIETALGVTIP